MSKETKFSKLSSNELFCKIVDCYLQLIILQQKKEMDTKQYRALYKQAQTLSSFLAKRANTNMITITDKAYNDAQVQMTLQKVI